MMYHFTRVQSKVTNKTLHLRYPSLIYLGIPILLKSNSCYPFIGTTQTESDILSQQLPEQLTLSKSKAVEVQPCSTSSNVPEEEESRYPQVEPATEAGSSYSSSRQTRSQTGSLPFMSPTGMTLAEEMNSKKA